MMKEMKKKNNKLTNVYCSGIYGRVKLYAANMIKYALTMNLKHKQRSRLSVGMFMSRTEQTYSLFYS